MDEARKPQLTDSPELTHVGLFSCVVTTGDLLVALATHYRVVVPGRG